MLTLSLIGLPLLGGLLTFLLPSQAKAVALGTALATLGVVLTLAAGFVPTAQVQYAFSFDWIASAGIKFSLGIDGISLVLVLLTGMLVPVILLSTMARTYANPARFYGLTLLMQAALMGVFVAKDAFVFYFFFEAALLPVYFLAAQWGGENRVTITFKFFVYTIFGSLFMLLALVYLYIRTPENHTSDITAFYNLGLTAKQQGFIFWAFFVAFAIKMPVFPFHTWQPDAYTVSPAPATMLLSGIMLKMGTYGLIRFLLPIVPLGLADWGLVAIVLSVIGIVYGSVVAIKQNDMKRLLAYSSFAHVGLMAAGILVANLSALQGAMIQMLAHGINVVGLFFVIDVIENRTQTRLLNSLGGITQQAPRLTVCLVVLMLGSVALPLTNGFVGEFLLLKGVYEYNAWLGAIAGLTIILGAVYMLRLVQKSMFGAANAQTKQFTDLTNIEQLVLYPLVVLVFWIGLAPNTFLQISQPAVEQLLKLIGKA
jgi:NADH-quinone oxidoreductase subunit M